MCEPTTYLLFITDNTGENFVGRNGAEAETNTSPFTAIYKRYMVCVKQIHRHLSALVGIYGIPHQDA